MKKLLCSETLTFKDWPLIPVHHYPHPAANHTRTAAGEVCGHKLGAACQPCAALATSENAQHIKGVLASSGLGRW